MRLILRLLTLPLRAVITVFILLCSAVISCSCFLFGLASGLLFLMALIVLTYSAHNALILFALAFLVSPLGLPMAAVGILTILNSIRSFLRFS